MASLILNASSLTAFSQSNGQPNDQLYRNGMDDSLRYWITRGCKFRPVQPSKLPAIAEASPVPEQSPFIRIHGNIRYDFSYRSFVDTPFAQNDFSQHYVQTTLDLTIKDRYPVKVIFSSRQSNSPYFDDITDVQVQFNRSSYINSLKQDLYKQLNELPDKSKLTQVEQLYKRKLTDEEQLRNWLNSPARLQEIVEEKEKLAAERLRAGLPQKSSSSIPGEDAIRKNIIEKIMHKSSQLKDSAESKTDSLLTGRKQRVDSVKSRWMTLYERKKDELDSLNKELKEYQKKYKTVKKSFDDSITRLKKEITSLTDASAIKDFIRRNRIDPKTLPKDWQLFSSIDNIGIGRSWVDYSELTVKNISLTGVNVELNPSRFYLAFAAGRINYRYRDFVVKNNDRQKQSLYLIRAGIGRKDKNNLIFTWYDGKRSLINSFTASAFAGLERVMGMSIESRLALDQNHYITLEAAKSSFNNAATIGQPSSQLAEKVFNFKDHSNQAYSIKIYNNWAALGTKLSGYYRRFGEHFQSFNLQPVDSRQEAFQVKASQQMFKNRLTIEAGFRKNDFSNPYINPGVSSKTVFKSAQASLRVPKYPFVSVGYFPASQLTVLDNNIVVENQYQTFTAVVSHAYRVKTISMSTSAVWMKFFNSGSDTGFIYYNAATVMLNHYFYFKNLQLESGLTRSLQKNLKVTTLEQSATYQLKSWLSITGGLNYNTVNLINNHWGTSAAATVNIKKTGSIQFQYDKNYLPGTNKDLLPVKTGRVSYYKIF